MRAGEFQDFVRFQDLPEIRKMQRKGCSLGEISERLRITKRALDHALWSWISVTDDELKRLSPTRQPEPMF